MLLALQWFTQSTVNSNGQQLSVSKLVKDLLLYSYPNSIIRLHRSPGGLRLALPEIDNNYRPPMHRSISEESRDKILALPQKNLFTVVEPAITASTASTSSSLVTVAAALAAPDAASLQTNVPHTEALLNIKHQLQQLERQPPSAYRMTPSPTVASFTTPSQAIYEPVFRTNVRLQEMLRLPAYSSCSHIFSARDIELALSAVKQTLNRSRLAELNPSQWEAIQLTLERPLSLIQGPPGTGKVVKLRTLNIP